MKPWRILIAAIACLGPVLQYWLMVHDQTLAMGAVKTAHYFSFFTILSNLLAAAALSAPLVALGEPVRRLGRAQRSPRPRSPPT
ncbi:hypothetical protein ACRAWD_12395 [Caulobacter segnis]